MGAVAISGVAKSYGEVLALDEVSLDIADGEFCAILGHSGCGKTTLLNMVAGFDAPSRGEIRVDGALVEAPSWQRAMIFQDYALFPWLTVAENVAFGLEMKRLPAHKRAEIVRAHVELVGLGGFEDKRPHEL